MPAGRPSSYTLEIGETFCEGVAQAQSAIDVCEQIGVSDSAVWDWLDKHPEFAAMYARARERRGERMAQWILDIVRQVASGDLAPDQARVMADSLKWLAAKWYPRTYGDHSHKTMTIEAGEGYTRLLEAIERRRGDDAVVIDAQEVSD